MIARLTRDRRIALVLLTGLIVALHMLALDGEWPRAGTQHTETVMAIATRSLVAAQPQAVDRAAQAPLPPVRAPQRAAPQPKRLLAAAASREASLPGPPMPSADDAAQRYPTRLPPPTTLHYELRRGAAAGEGELRWQHDGERYDARLDAQLDGAQLLQWASRGGFDAAGVAPERFVAQGRRRSAQAVNFQRQAGKITFSGPTLEHPLAAGAQDRLSWMLQLAAIVAARAPPAGGRIVMQVAGPRGDAEAWRFDVVGETLIDTDGGPVPALHLRREAQRRYDLRVDVWLDPARHHLPMRAVLGVQGDGREPLELRLRAGEPREPGSAAS